MRIKCPYCNGKGFSELNSAVNMTCGWCMGQGELDLEIVPTEPQTNEEWFCHLSTEEKVKALLDLRERIRQKMRAEIGSENKFYKGDYYREWLKEKHE